MTVSKTVDPGSNPGRPAKKSYVSFRVYINEAGLEESVRDTLFKRDSGWWVNNKKVTEKEYLSEKAKYFLSKIPGLKRKIVRLKEEIEQLERWYKYL
jgi:hypothetical protein